MYNLNDENPVSSKAPEDFKVNEKKVTESGEIIPAKPEKFDVTIKSGLLTDEIDSSKVPSTYNLVEKKIDLTDISVSATPEAPKKETYKYKIPEGYSLPKQVLVEKKEEPKEVIKEEVLEDPKSPEETMIDTIADQITAVSKRSEENVLNDVAQQAVTEQKIQILERQLGDLRRLVSEVQQGTIVHGLGVGGSGGGEVNLKYLDDVDITTILDGETIVWDSFLGKFIPQAASGGELDLAGVNRQLFRLSEKFISMDNRLQEFIDRDTRFVKLEDNTVEEGTSILNEPRTFIDQIADGDTTSFVVGIDPQRGVWTLDDIPQPTIQVPRGDIIVFDLSAIPDPTKFDIYTNGVTLDVGKVRVEAENIESITVTTSQVPSNIYKLYYKHTEKNGMGWIINITDH